MGMGLGLVNSITNLQMKLAHLHSSPDRRSSGANLAISKPAFDFFKNKMIAEVTKAPGDSKPTYKSI